MAKTWDLAIDALGDLVGVHDPTLILDARVEAGPDIDFMTDKDTNQIHGHRTPVLMDQDGGGTAAGLPDTSDPRWTPGGHQLRLVIGFRESLRSPRKEWASKWFNLTANSTFAEVDTRAPRQVDDELEVNVLEAAERAETAAASVQREATGGVAGLDGSGKLYESRLPDRLSELSLSTTIAGEVEPALNAVRANPTYAAHGPIVTFVDDDGSPLFNDIWRPLAAAKGIKVTFAVVGASVMGDPTSTAEYPSLDLAALKAIEAEGHDIVSHGWRHLATYDPAVTPEMLAADYAIMAPWMREHFPTTAHIHVYPGGLSPTNVAKKSVARKFWRYAIDTTSANSHNPDPVDNWSVQRVNGDTLTLAQLKAKFDATVLANGWLIVMTHDSQLDTAGGGRAAQVAKLGDFIDYVKAANAPILKFSEAEKIRGNAIALGEFTEAGSSFVSHTGKTKHNGAAGTWTPTLYGTTVAGSHTYNQRKGHYQVNGGMVTVKGSISIPGGTKAVLTGATPAVNIGTGGSLGMTINGTTYGVALVAGDTPASVVTKINAAWGPGTTATLVGGKLTLTSTGTGPATTYVVASGQGTILADLGLTVGQSAAGAVGGFDPATSGTLRIGGLPFVPTALDVSGVAPCSFNRFNLGANWQSVWVNTGSTDSLALTKQGSGAAAASLAHTDVVTSETLNLQFVITYMIPPTWTA